MENLFCAYRSCSKGKRLSSRYARFSEMACLGLLRLRDAILSGTYVPLPPATFDLWCKSGQKTRVISAPAFRDLVVQHALYDYVYPLFEKGWIYDSYGCRIGGGAHRASDRCQSFMRQSPEDSWYLQLDIRRYYYSIRHDILRESLARKVKNPLILDLLMSFCDTASPCGTGLCVGSVIAQFFGLVYLDRLDHFVKRTLKVRHYIRYVDDIVIIGESRERCLELKRLIEVFIREELGLEFSKWRLDRVSRGINYVGYRTWRERRLVRRRALRVFRNALRSSDPVRLTSILGHARHTASYGYMVSKIRAAGVAVLVLEKNS